MIEFLAVLNLCFFVYFLAYLIVKIVNGKKAIKRCAEKFECSEDDVVFAVAHGVATDVYQLEKLTKIQFKIRFNKLIDVMFDQLDRK